MTQDPLYQIFEKHLFDATDINQTSADLVNEVVGEYIFVLMNQGNIPDKFLDTLEEDLLEEVIYIYRKKTYGFVTLKEFRLAKLPAFS